MRKYVLPGLLSLLVFGASLVLAFDAYFKGQAASTTAASTTTTAPSTGKPKPAAEPRKIDRRLVFGSIIMLAVAGLATSTRPIRQEFSAERSLAYRRKLEGRLSAILVALDRSDTKTEWYKVGLHVWMIPRWYRAITPDYSIRRRVPGPARNVLRSTKLSPRLKRRAKIRHQDDQDPTGIYWRRQKGVIGRCWHSKKPVFFNNERDFRPYLHYDEKQWSALKDDQVTMRLKFSEFDRLKTRYGDVAAVPIFVKKGEDDEHPDLVGVLAFDTPAGSHETKKTLEDTVLPLLREGARQIAKEVLPTRR